MNHALDQYEVTLTVPDLRKAVAFYSTLLDTRPKAAVRRLAWFDVPDSPLRLALRDRSAPCASSVRVCTDTTRLRATTARLRRKGVPITASGLAADGHPRAVELGDPGGNRLEFCASLTEAPVVQRRRIDIAGLVRTAGQLLRRSLSPGPVDERFADERARDESMLLRFGRRT